MRSLGTRYPAHVAARATALLALCAFMLSGETNADSANSDLTNSDLTNSNSAVEPIIARLAAADAAAGETVFLQCAVCHVSKPGARITIGPNLWNIVGRKIASESGFDYSESLQKADGNWSFERLNVYLFNPKLVAPEGSMPFPGIKSADERAHLIAYLRILSDDPVALPHTPASDSDQTDADKNMAEPDDDPDKWQGLPPGPGREDVFYRCKSCHSLMIVKQQGLSRDAWDESLDWMVEEQGMPPIEEEYTRNQILDYLSTNFGLK